MIWQNPWAWLAVVSLALPILIHLLGRGRARVQPFPSLRFLERSRLLPTRRTRIHDLPLLLVRLGALLAAVAALAAPLVRTQTRSRAPTQSLARAIVVDTSVAADSARRSALRFASDAATSVVLETHDPMSVLSGAVTWLDRQSGRRELIVVADARGGLTAADTARVSSDVGLQLVVLPGPELQSEPARARAVDGEMVVTQAFGPAGTDAEWTARSATPTSYDGLRLFAPLSQRARLLAATRAAATLGARLPFDSARAIAIVYPEYEQRDALRRSASPLASPWMTRVVAALRGDSVLLTAARTTTAPGATAGIQEDSSGLVISRDASGRALVMAVQGSVDGRATLLLFSSAEPGSLASAALIAAVDHARSLAPAIAPRATKVTEQTMRAWTRTASDGERATQADTTGDSDGRWLWALALVLLALETWMRRVKRESVAQEMVHDRAA